MVESCYWVTFECKINEIGSIRLTINGWFDKVFFEVKYVPNIKKKN